MGSITGKIQDIIDEYGSMENYWRKQKVKEVLSSMIDPPKAIRTGNVNIETYPVEEEDLSLKLLGSLISNAINNAEDAGDMFSSVKNILVKHNIYHEPGK